MTVEHLDDEGKPCPRHVPATFDDLMFLAIIGSRASGFHHDLASKLQGLLMSLDELSELSQHEPQLRRASETSLESLREVLALLNTNRALTKPAMRTAVAVRDLLARASARVYVSLTGELVDATVEVAGPATIHALSLAFDVAAGPGRGRTLAATAAVDGTHVELRLDCSAALPASSAESLAIATYVFARDDGSLSCTASGSHLVVRLPLAAG